MKRYYVLIILAAFSITFITSCKKDKGEPPILPSANSMTIDFSNFQSGKKGDLSVSIPKGTQNSNWEFSAGVALLWQTIIYTTLAVPVTSFQLVVNQTPAYVEDKTWQWSANATILNTTYKARLTGQIAASNVVWKMYITREGAGGFNDFLWFEGTSDFDGMGGQWQLYLSPANPVKVVQIDWEMTSATLGMVKYTYIKTGDNFVGSYIEYGLTTNTLSAYYTIHYYDTQYLQFFDLNVEWNPALHNGRVKSLGHFGTTDWYCWDGNYLNVTCP
jgi:hypothetical protein